MKLSTDSSQNPANPPITNEKLSKTVQCNECGHLSKIEEIVNSIAAQDLSVQEFVALISPYTSDNGKTKFSHV